MMKNHEEIRRKQPQWQWIVAFFVLWLMISWLDLFDWYYEFSRAHEQFWLDEFAASIPALLVVVVLYAMRRSGQLHEALTKAESARVSLAEQEQSLENSLRELDAQTRQLKDLVAVLEKQRDGAEAANLAKSQFLANMSHELRTPLNAILGFSDMLCCEILGPIGASKYREYAAYIHSSGEHLLELINDVLDVAKIEARKYQVHRRGFDVGPLVTEALTLVEARARNGDVRLLSDLETNMSLVFADRRAVKQVLVNLLTNAVKFTPKGGIVSLSACESEGTLTMSVRDTGVGIPAEDLERIFEPFAQVDRKDGHLHEGTGLGLPLSRALVAMHGGTMEVESEAGVGTVFTFSLPAATHITWQAGMSVNVEQFDSDHRALLTVIDQLAAAIQRKEDWSKVEELLATLIRYVRVHLAAEERVMAALAYPALEAHRAEHDQFRAWIDDIQSGEALRGDATEVMSVTEYLVNWWFDHIMNSDAGYAEFFAGRDEEIAAVLKDYEGVGGVASRTPDAKLERRCA